VWSDVDDDLGGWSNSRILSSVWGTFSSIRFCRHSVYDCNERKLYPTHPFNFRIAGLDFRSRQSLIQFCAPTCSLILPVDRLPLRFIPDAGHEQNYSHVIRPFLSPWLATGQVENAFGRVSKLTRKHCRRNTAIRKAGLTGSIRLPMRAFGRSLTVRHLPFFRESFLNHYRPALKTPFEVGYGCPRWHLKFRRHSIVRALSLEQSGGSISLAVESTITTYAPAPHVRHMFF
jgi:hypothetical protein